MEKNQLSEINVKQKIGVILFSFVISGIVGFIYETIFYYFNNGEILKRGSTFGPWIQIYSFGGMLILLICYKMRKYPWLVFIVSGAVSGVLEYITGYILYTYCGGIRSWDYNVEILNFGNINGFICLRSVLVFCFGGTMLIYMVIPTLVKIAKKINPNTFFVTALVIACICGADIFYNDVLADNLHLINARTVYHNAGWPLN